MTVFTQIDTHQERSSLCTLVLMILRTRITKAVRIANQFKVSGIART